MPSPLLFCWYAAPRSEDAPAITRNEFLQELKKEMPPALDRLTRIANIRPVDLATSRHRTGDGDLFPLQ